MINFNSQAATHTMNSLSTQTSTSTPQASTAGMSSKEAAALSQSISQIDPATLLAAGANRTTGYAQALALVD